MRRIQQRGSVRFSVIQLGLYRRGTSIAFSDTVRSRNSIVILVLSIVFAGGEQVSAQDSCLGILTATGQRLSNWLVRSGSKRPHFNSPQATALIHQFYSAAKMVRRNQLEKAINLLNRPDILSGLGVSVRRPSGKILNSLITLEGARLDTIDLSRIRTTSESEAFADIVAQAQNSNQYSRLFKIVFLSEPPELSTPPTSAQIYGARAWLRFAFEEFGHALQDVELPPSAEIHLLSHLLRTRPELVLEIERLVSFANKQIGPHSEPRINWLAEVDIYAFMIEVLGSAFVPTFVGEQTGYILRWIVDRELGRPWAQKPNLTEL